MLETADSTVLRKLGLASPHCRIRSPPPLFFLPHDPSSSKKKRALLSHAAERACRSPTSSRGRAAPTRRQGTLALLPQAAGRAPPPSPDPAGGSRPMEFAMEGMLAHVARSRRSESATVGLPPPGVPCSPYPSSSARPHISSTPPLLHLLSPCRKVSGDGVRARVRASSASAFEYGSPPRVDSGVLGFPRRQCAWTKDASPLPHRSHAASEVEPRTKQTRAVVGGASLIDARVHSGALIHAGDVAVAMAKVMCLTKCVNGVNLPLLG